MKALVLGSRDFSRYVEDVRERLTMPLFISASSNGIRCMVDGQLEEHGMLVHTALTVVGILDGARAHDTSPSSTFLAYDVPLFGADENSSFIPFSMRKHKFDDVESCRALVKGMYDEAGFNYVFRFPECDDDLLVRNGIVPAQTVKVWSWIDIVVVLQKGLA